MSFLLSRQIWSKTMYKIMLVEDEPEVLDSMLRIIRWELVGFETPRGCRDGRQALDLLEEGFTPDVVITDICMPHVDGLELTAWLGEHLPDTLVIILSGYDEFGYAQRAIQYRVHDYVLKPVTPYRVEEILVGAAEALRQQRFSSEHGIVQIAELHFLNRLLTAQMDAAVIAENCRQYSLNLDSAFYSVAVADIDRLPPQEDPDDSSELDLLRYALQNIAAELLQKQKGLTAFQGTDRTLKLISGGQTAEESSILIKNAVEEIAQKMQEALKCSLSAGFGESMADLSGLYYSHQQALSALALRFYSGEGSRIDFNEEIEKHGRIDFMQYESQFEQAIRAFDTDTSLATLHKMFDALQKERVPFEKCVKYCQRLVVLLLNFTSSLVEDKELHLLESAWEKSNLYDAHTIKQMEQLMLAFCEQVFELQSLVSGDSTSALMLQAETFIKENYSNPKLSLQMVTDHLAISTSYFSSIFKTRFGATFVEYLTRMRMEKAKQILIFTDHRTYETAEEVGFSDPHYFSVAFKKFTGMTPKEYRENKRKQRTTSEAPCAE